jgi:hypothetical protein
MRFILKIISSNFYLPIDIDEEDKAFKKAKLILETYGLKETSKSSKDIMIFRTTSLFQHVFSHPFAKTFNTKLEVIKSSENCFLEYRIFHPLSILAPLGALFFINILDWNNLLFLSLIFLIAEVGFTFLMQYSVIKQIQKELEKKVFDDILDN